MATFKPILHDRLILIIALAAFLLPTLAIEYYVLQHTNGVFSYPLDDSFIHLAIAKTLAFNHVWGISRYEFASASSSILYPILIATTFLIFGAHTAIGFILNTLAGAILLIAIQRWLTKRAIKPLSQLWILLSVIALTPLPVIVICGMEHTLQLLFCFLFITRWSDEWSSIQQRDQAGTNGAGFSPWVYIYGALLVATRYEGAVIVGVACLILLLHRKWFLTLQLGLASLLPILVFGIISYSKGSYFIPNSVLLKSGAPPLTFDGLYQFFTEGLYERLSFSIVGYNTVASQRLLLLLPLTYLLFRRQLKEAVSYHYQIILLMAAVFVHLSFAGFVHFPRYEAYLIGCSVAITGSLVAKYGAGLFRTKQILLQWMGGVTTALILSPLFIRSKDAFRDIGQACINIYEQQYQMGQLLHRYYNTSSVAIGDIGAVSYFTEGKNLDLVGLANIEVARSKKNNYYTPNFLYELNKREKVKVAICYEYYTYPQLFLRWTKVATWTIPNNVTCGDATVSIFAVDPAEKDNLVKHLREFESHLPRDVTVRYYY